MLEPIRGADDELLAYVIRSTTGPDETTFVTPPSLELQVGFIVYGAGSAIVPHLHAPMERHLSRTCEVILVRSGKCEVDVYDDAHELVASRELNVGDLVILARGGHGFRMIEDTVQLEVKQGPYFGLVEKERFE